MESPKPKLSSAIVLDESQFPDPDRYSPIDELEEFAKKTFRRYEESNVSIDAFSLCLKTDSYARFGRATEWTLKALKLGATDLTFRSDHPSINIPLEEVFGNENVVQLRLESFRIIDKLKVTKCPGLKSLTLSNLTMEIDSFFNIILCCPSVENMSLSNISYNKHVKYVHYDYVHYDYVGYVPPPLPPLPPLPPTLILHDLRSLVLCNIDSHFPLIETLFFDDMSSKFPNLKHLTLGITPYFSYALEVIRNISSASLETLNIMGDDRLYDREGRTLDRDRVTWVEFDVPSIRKFKFESKYIPDVSFRSTRYQWEESHVSITNDDKRMLNNDGLSTTWFLQLSKFLTNLRGSKIHLCLHVESYYSFDYDVEELGDLDVCEVEDLSMDIPNLWSLSCNALLDALFRICRPKIITINPNNNAYCNDYNYNRNNDLFICRAVEQAIQEKSSLLMSSQFMYGLSDLEEIDAQELMGEVWKTRPLGSILADLKVEIHARRELFDEDGKPLAISKIIFRLLLKWKSYDLHSYEDD